MTDAVTKQEDDIERDEAIQAIHRSIRNALCHHGFQYSVGTYRGLEDAEMVFQSDELRADLALTIGDLNDRPVTSRLTEGEVKHFVFQSLLSASASDFYAVARLLERRAAGRNG